MISERCSLGLSDDELARWRDDDLNPARMALIRAHTSTCTACQERLAAFEAIGAGLRGLEPPPLDVARLLADLRNTTSTAAATSTLRPAPARMPTNAPRSSRRLVTGVAGLAAVLVVSLLAAYIFATYGPLRPAGNTNPSGVLPIPLDAMPLQATVISMSSRTDGWAFGSKAYDGSKPVIALHYTDGKWTRVQTVVNGRINALKMLSANDGWLVGSNVYHYDGHAWRAVTVPRQGAYDEYEQIAAVSPSAIWITGRSDKPFMLHYDGSAWVGQTLPMPQALHLGYYEFSGISMSSANEGWAIGNTFYSPTNNAANNDMTSLGVLLHYTGGVWTVEKTYPTYTLMTIAMASASDGWIGGSYETDIKHNADGSSSAIDRPFLWRFNNGSWRDAPIPGGYKPPLEGQVSYIQMLSPTVGWMIAGISAGASLGSNTNPLFHMQNGQWVQFPGYTVPGPPDYYATAFISSDEFWGFGRYGISHYYKGVWKNVVA